YEAYGWHVQTVDWTHGDGEYSEDVEALHDALLAAREVTDRPSFIQLRTIIGWPAPNKQNTGDAHGSSLGEDEVAATKEILGFDPAKKFEVSDEVIAHTRGLLERGAAAEAEWNETFQQWRGEHAEAAALFDRLTRRELPEGWDAGLPTFD